MYRIVTVLIFCISLIFGEQHSSSNKVQLRVVGGKPGSIELFPYLAALLHRGVIRCGSSIINERALVTAAHCFRDVLLHKLQVRVGSAFGDKINTGVLHDVDDYVTHPNYSQLIQNFDLAVVWVKSSIVYGSKVQPIHLPSSSDKLPYGQSGVVAGWGRTAENGPFPDKFHYFQPPIIERKNCIRSGGGGYASYRITEAMFCAGYLEGGQDACKSDSGGPFVINNKLIGVVSFGEGCGRAKLPGVYTNVAYLRPWIDQVLAEKESKHNFNKN